MNLEDAKRLTRSIAEIGEPQKEEQGPNLPEFLKEKESQSKEELTRYLMLTSVLDQGPDPQGVRLLLNKSLKKAREEDINILKNPKEFFKNIFEISKIIEDTHEEIKDLRAEEWAEYNNSKPEKYSLFFYQSLYGMRTVKRPGWYILSRWGTPLFYMHILEEDHGSLRDYLEDFKSTENMTIQLKDHEDYGFGKAIGNKACHLFGKWYVHTFNLVRKKEDKGWDGYSYEIPLDSNAGRVLFRTGWLRTWADLDYYKSKGIIQQDKGKGGNDYLRVTNIRGKSAQKNGQNKEIRERYDEVIKNHLRLKKRWRKMEIQQIPNALLLRSDYTVGELDDGLMYIGTNYCFNHSNPKCDKCPINDLCEGFKSNQKLIRDYRT